MARQDRAKKPSNEKRERVDRRNPVDDRRRGDRRRGEQRKGDRRVAGRRKDFCPTCGGELTSTAYCPSCKIRVVKIRSSARR